MDVLGRIKELMEQRGWTSYRLAKECGRPVNTVSDMFSRGTFPTIPTLELYCKAFHISLTEFFAMDDEPVILTDEQKKLLSAYDRLGNKERELAYSYILGLTRNSPDDLSHNQ